MVGATDGFVYPSMMVCTTQKSQREKWDVQKQNPNRMEDYSQQSFGRKEGSKGSSSLTSVTNHGYVRQSLWDHPPSTCVTGLVVEEALRALEAGDRSSEHLLDMHIATLGRP